MKTLSFQLFIFFILLSSPNFSQVKTNLEVFKILTDSLANKIIYSLPENVNSLEFIPNEVSQLNVITDYLKSNLIKNKIKLVKDSKADESLSVTFSDIKVEYDNLHKEHLFGKYFMTRNIVLSGSYLLLNENKSYDFSFSSMDTVEYDGYTKLESKIYPFTEGKEPKEPFFSNLIEPVIAVAATATAVILFFTVRSK